MPQDMVIPNNLQFMVKEESTAYIAWQNNPSTIVTISVILNTRYENLVIDMGSSVSLIDSSFLETLRGTPSLIEEKIDEKRFMKTANGGSLNLVGSAKIIVFLSPQNEVEIRFQVAENLSTNMLLGLQTLRNMGTKTDCVNQAVHFEALDLFIPWAPFSSPIYLCLRISSEEREIPPKTHVWVPTKIVDDPLIKEIGHREQWESFYVEGILGENYDLRLNQE